MVLLPLLLYYRFRLHHWCFLLPHVDMCLLMYNCPLLLWCSCYCILPGLKLFWSLDPTRELRLPVSRRSTHGAPKYYCLWRINCDSHEGASIKVQEDISTCSSSTPPPIGCYLPRCPPSSNFLQKATRWLPRRARLWSVIAKLSPANRVS